MPDYAAFGGCLRSAALEFPELRAASGSSPDWSLVMAPPTDSAPAHIGELLGSEQLDDAASVTLTRYAAGLSLDFTDTGRYDITGGGSEITWYPVAGADDGIARSDILGRVLACALHLQGEYVGHASGVVLGGEAVGFLAPKGYGKSTLALALVRGGARLLTDDTFAVAAGPARPHARPGIHSVRLWDDSAAAVAAGTTLAIGASGKLEARALPADALQSTTAPLAALYILAPTESTTAPVRQLLNPVHAAVALVQHSRLGPLLGGSAGKELLIRATQLARTIPCFVLGVPRALDALPATVRQIVEWHPV